MKKILLLSLCCICFTGLFAQEKSIDTEYRSYFEFKEGEKGYLFGDNVNVRARPSTTARVLASLPINTPITIIGLVGERKDFLTLNGITAPWVKIQFGKAEEVGFVWAPLIAQYQVPTPHFTYLFGVTKIENEQLYGQLRIVKYGKLWEQKDFPVIGDLFYLTNAKLYDSRGLNGIDGVLELGFTFEGCGPESGTLLYVIEKDAVDYLGRTSSAVDGSMSYQTTDFIFPASADLQSRKDKIIKRKEMGSFDEVGNGTINTEISIWEWSGRKLVKAIN